VYTAFPIIVYTLYDFQFAKSELMTTPKYYSIGLNSKNFSLITDECFGYKIFARWLFMGAWQGLFIFFITFVPFEWSSNINGMTSSLWMEGTFCYAGVCIVANAYILGCSHSHNWLNISVIFSSVLLFFIVHAFLSSFTWSELFGSFVPLFLQPEYWFILVYVTFAIMIISHFYNQLYTFTDQTIGKKMDKCKTKSKVH
jgi:magnesium-transporting ATPase (P-type)